MNISEALNNHMNEFIGQINDVESSVVGVVTGEKITNGVGTGVDAIVYFVGKKLPLSLVKESLPISIDGFPTDVVEVGTVTIGDPRTLGRTDRHRPAPCGISIGHIDITAGTMGCLVRKGGKEYILSNNHVLANSNAASIGDPILQPGTYDGGTVEDRIATLADLVEISFNDAAEPCPITGAVAWVFNAIATLLGRGSRLQATTVSAKATTNLVDAAIAAPVEAVLPEIFELCTPTGIAKAEAGMDIQKSGRTTGVTTGTVDYTGATIQVGYGDAVAIFSDQLVAGDMCAGGDSGAAVLDMDGNVVGLLFAGSDTTTIINPIGNVMSELGLDGVLTE